jgi:hypothetical protein
MRATIAVPAVWAAILAAAPASAQQPPAKTEAQPLDPPLDPALEPEDEPVRKRGNEVTISFAGGALVPRGDMEQQTEAGLDVWGRVGWITPSGLGLVLHLEYAPLRRDVEAPDDVVEAHLFAATAGPRFTIGRDLIRVWLAGSAGVVIERVTTTTADLPSVVEVDTELGVSGGGGLDLCFFGAGGVTFAGAYTQAVSSGAIQRYVSLNAGVVFVY